MRSGILYPQGKHKTGEVDIASIVKELKRIAWRLRWIGGILMGIAIFGLGLIYEPLVSVELSYRLNPPVVEPVSKFRDANQDLPNWKVPNPSYSLFIPKIAAKSQVIPGVDAGNPEAYLAALKLGVAEAAGLSHPGQIGTTYLFAHSTDSPINFARYNAIFYLLDKVAVGDAVEVVYQKKLYKYQAVSTEIVGPEDIRYLVPQQDEEKLVLQTKRSP
jgi:LPXTG-site transpeptidase (sortase) family protein